MCCIKFSERRNSVLIERSCKRKIDFNIWKLGRHGISKDSTKTNSGVFSQFIVFLNTEIKLTTSCIHCQTYTIGMCGNVF